MSGRAFKRKADVPSFSSLRRTAINEVEREQLLKNIVQSDDNGAQNEVAVQTAFITSPALVEDESTSLVYKELVAREVYFDKDAKMERSSRRTSVAFAHERRSSLYGHGSSAMGRRSSHLQGLLQGGKDRSSDDRTGSLGDLHIGLPRKRSQILGAGSKPVRLGSLDK